MGAGEQISVIPNAGGHCYESGKLSGPSTCLTPENTAGRHWFWWWSLPRRSGLLYAIYLSLKRMRLLNCSGMLFYSENFPTCSKWNFASTVTEFGKPRRDLSTIAWKSLYKFAVTRTPRATWVPIFRCAAMLKRCSEMRLAGSTVIMDLWSPYTRNPKCLRVMPSVSLPCEQSTDSFFQTEESLFQLNLFKSLLIDHGIPWFEIESHETIPFLPSWLLDA